MPASSRFLYVFLDEGGNLDFAETKHRIFHDDERDEATAC